MAADLVGSHRGIAAFYRCLVRADRFLLFIDVLDRYVPVLHRLFFLLHFQVLHFSIGCKAQISGWRYQLIAGWHMAADLVGSHRGIAAFYRRLVRADRFLLFIDVLDRYVPVLRRLFFLLHFHALYFSIGCKAQIFSRRYQLIAGWHMAADLVGTNDRIVFLKRKRGRSDNSSILYIVHRDFHYRKRVLGSQCIHCLA